jgi:hypothetical protein
MRARLLAVVAGLATGLAGLIVVLHTPLGRPLMRRLGVACPATKVSPVQVEAVRRRAVAAMRGGLPSPARPALGQTLDVGRPADVTSWARSHGLRCVEETRAVHTIKCTDSADPSVRDPKAPPKEQIAFAFAPDGRLVSVDRLRSTLTPVEATRLFGEAADQLLAALGPGQVVGDASPDYLASGSMHGARLAYRFSDYLATVTAMNLGGRIVMHEQYESARGG